MLDDHDPRDIDSLLRADHGVDVEIPAGSVAPGGLLVDWWTLTHGDAKAERNSLREWAEWVTASPTSRSRSCRLPVQARSPRKGALGTPC